MKALTTAIVLASAFVAAHPGGGQMQEADEEQLEYFVFIYQRGPAWAVETAPLDQAGMTGHFQRMQELEDAGILVTGGPFKDLSGALGILEVATLAEAKEIVAGDPLVAAGTMTGDVFPWHPSVVGCTRAKPWSPGP